MRRALLLLSLTGAAAWHRLLAEPEAALPLSPDCVDDSNCEFMLSQLGGCTPQDAAARESLQLSCARTCDAMCGSQGSASGAAPGEDDALSGAPLAAVESSAHVDRVSRIEGETTSSSSDAEAGAGLSDSAGEGGDEEGPDYLTTLDTATSVLQSSESAADYVEGVGPLTGQKRGNATEGGATPTASPRDSEPGFEALLGITPQAVKFSDSSAQLDEGVAAELPPCGQPGGEPCKEASEPSVVDEQETPEATSAQGHPPPPSPAESPPPPVARDSPPPPEQRPGSTFSERGRDEGTVERMDKSYALARLARDHVRRFTRRHPEIPVPNASRL